MTENKKNNLFTMRDEYDSLWKRRDFEFERMWQRSIVLTAFLIAILSAYGGLWASVLNKDTPAIQISFSIINTSNWAYPIFRVSPSYQIGFMVIAIMGLLFSFLWILMAKGSKLWTEKFEKTINEYHNNDFYQSKVFNSAYNKNLEWPENLKAVAIEDENGSIYSTDGGHYSASRINIMIGQIFFVFWVLVLIFHSSCIIISFAHIQIMRRVCLTIAIVSCILVIIFSLQAIKHFVSSHDSDYRREQRRQNKFFTIKVKKLSKKLNKIEKFYIKRFKPQKEIKALKEKNTNACILITNLTTFTKLLNPLIYDELLSFDIDQLHDIEEVLYIFKEIYFDPNNHFTSLTNKESINIPKLIHELIFKTRELKNELQILPLLKKITYIIASAKEFQTTYAKSNYNILYKVESTDKFKQIEEKTSYDKLINYIDKESETNNQNNELPQIDEILNFNILQSILLDLRADIQKETLTVYKNTESYQTLMSLFQESITICKNVSANYKTDGNTIESAFSIY